MKRFIKSLLVGLIISLLSYGGIIYAQVSPYVQGRPTDYGNILWWDRNTGNTLFTIQSGQTTTYGDGFYVENDMGSIELPITAAYCYANSTIIQADATTSPGMATNDLSPSAVWAASEEGSTSATLSYAIGWTVTIPRDFRDGTDVQMEIAISTASGSSGAYFEFCILENKDGTAFDTAATGVPLGTAATTTNTKVDVMSATDTTNDHDAGDVITVWLYPVEITTGNVELKSARLKYHRQFNN